MVEKRPALSYPQVLALGGTVLYFALLVCAFGFISLFSDTEVAQRGDAALAVGLIAAVVAVAVESAALFQRARRYQADLRPGVRTTLPLGGAFITALAVWLLYAVSGAVAYAVQTETPVEVLFYGLAVLTSGHGIAAGILAGVVLLSYAAILAVTGQHPHRPLWPWEQRD